MVPVYLYKCMVWSDGEEHPDEDHNEAYDFEYIILEKNVNGTYILSIPQAILLESHSSELEENEIVREISKKEVFKVLSNYRTCKHQSVVTRFAEQLKKIGSDDG